MSRTLTSEPELFSDLSWELLLLGEENAKKWGHSELNIEHIIQTLFTAQEFVSFISNLSIDEDIVLDITENFLEETPIDNSNIFTIGEDLEILLDNANLIKNQWGSNLIEIPHLIIAIARDLRLGCYVFKEGNLTIENLEIESSIPLYILKSNQILISISDRSLAFIVENHMSKIFSLLASYSVEVNMMQNSAVSFSICVDNDKYKIPKLINT